jgi:pyruvate/2-oxoglutarate dehydrogenase complex dihydrolipoamide dehydrogenase (E3) component
MPRYDIVAIGGGTAGLVTAAGAAGLGARVALVEAWRLGGECLWTGCVPSKALVAAARAAHTARHAASLGVDVGQVVPDPSRIFEWIREAQRRIEPHDSPERFRSLGVEVVMGTARFTGEREISVEGRRLDARHMVIATGSRPIVPEIPGLADVPFLTNESLFSLDQLPRRLLILGAGVVGLEMAQAFARLGSEVQLLELAATLLPGEDAELVEQLTSCLLRDGVKLALGARVTRVGREGGDVVLDVESAGQRAQYRGDALLVATGRRGRIDELELSVPGIVTDNGSVTVDDRLRTNVPNIWGAGDVVGGLRFTHVADYEARTVVRNALFPFSARRDYRVVPWVIFTDPELAHVGLTERQARERHGEEVRVFRRPLDDLDRAIVDGQTAGMVKLITDRGGRLLGAHILGYGAGNMIAELALAMKHGLGAAQLSATIHPYPTYPEAIKQAADAWYRSRLTGLTKSLARWLVSRGG